MSFASLSKPYVLKLYVEDQDLRAYYEDKVSKHNTMVLTDCHADSGFDLAVPEDTLFECNQTKKIDLCVKAAMIRINAENCEPTLTSNLEGEPAGFYTYPRSSLGYKTKLRLANCVGIIDSGYRGNLMAVFDNIHPTQAHQAHRGDRLIQICAPDLSPFFIKLIDNMNELSETTRGTGGFGSTGMNCH